MVVIWNATIRKSVGIVMPRALSKIIGKMTYIGFGVCPSTYDPTIVVISSCFQRENKNNITWEVLIFTLSSKTWKMLPSSNVPRESIILYSPTQTAIDRFIYWLAGDHIIDGDDDVVTIKNLILSFDLITHEFKEVSLPVSIANNVDTIICVSKLNESLVVSAYMNDVNDGRVYGVWMMGEEDGVMTSFTKLFNIRTPDDDLVIRKVLGFTMSGEPIMETEKNYGHVANVKVYKPCSEHINDLGITGDPDSFFICPCTETLILVDKSDCCIISNDYRGKTDGCGARSGARND